MSLLLALTAAPPDPEPEPEVLPGGGVRAWVPASPRVRIEQRHNDDEDALLLALIL